MALTMYFYSERKKKAFKKVFKKPGLNGFDRVGAVVFTQHVFGQGGLVT